MDIYPAKKYWIPANPYKLWASNPEVTMVKKHYWFPVGWDKIKNLKMEDVEKSIAIHVFSSMGGDSHGELYSALKKDADRFIPCSSSKAKTRSAKKSQKANKKTRRNK